MVLRSSLVAASVALGLAVLPAHAQYNRDNGYKHQLIRRQAVTNDTSQVAGKTFDFVVVGGGVGGLAIAARLSENSNFTVAVIEAGGDGSDVHDQIYIPGYSYLNGLTVSSYDWNYETVQQQEIDSTSKIFTNRWPRGKGLGGSGAINGLFWCRASQAEYNSWDTLNPGSSIHWGWDEMQKYMKRSETLTPPPQNDSDYFHISYDINDHGTDGPIQAGWPWYFYDAVKDWIPAWEELGLPIPTDGASGNNRGAVITPSTLNTVNMSRSDPKAGYIDPMPPRDNLVVLTNHQVTKILWKTDRDGNNVVADGVEFGPDNENLSQVKVNKEVILSGGTVNTPQTLQLSGIGPQALLEGLGIQVQVALPGVGHNLQDHAATAVYLTTNDQHTWAELQDKTLAAAELQKWKTEMGRSKWSFINQAIGYPALEDIMTDTATRTSWINGVQSSFDKYASTVKNMYNEDDTVITGMQAQWNETMNYLNGEVGQLEILFTMYGGGVGQIGIQVALQHPFSRGTILINSTNPFDPPQIDPGYLTHSADMDILRAGVRFAIALSKTKSLGSYISGQTSFTEDTDDAINTGIRQDAHTEYHPMGTAAMLPLENGGVVNTSLIVYGTSNVRVVDASVMPLEISAHLMASTYGIAEKAADIIKTHYAQVASGQTPTVGDPDSGAAASTSASAGASQDSGAMSSTTRSIIIGCVVGAAGLAVIAVS
uniref:Glucose oxidase n=1 Tax=Basidioascus sp. TaxID=1907175 RepID=A0A7L4X764_9BASI|nr:glucose oxidase [Basidioascus sp.]